MRSTKGLQALSNIFMQSPQVILLRSFCITTYYMFSVGLQGDLGAGIPVLIARAAEVLSGEVGCK
jgi:hypothetical protein